MAASTRNLPQGILRYCEEVKSAVSLRTIRSMMDRARAKRLPQIPRNLVLLGLMLCDHPPMTNLYRGMTGGGDGLHALLFASNDMIERMNNANEMFISCTVQVVPVMYILYQRTSERLFVAVWHHILELAPGLQASLRVSSYERTIITSAREVWPQLEITGCWFYFCTLRLTQAPRDVLYMALSLPLVPVVRFAEGLQSIQVTGDEMMNLHPNILMFVHALRTQWFPLADLVAVSRTSLRSNDMCERYERNLVTRLRGPHRNLWAFFNRLNDIITACEAEWRNPQPIPQNRCRNCEETRIANLQDRMSTGRISITKFLLSVMDHRRRATIDSLLIDARGLGGTRYEDEEIRRQDIVVNDVEARAFARDAAPVAITEVEVVRALIEAPAEEIREVGLQEERQRAAVNKVEREEAVVQGNAVRENAIDPPVGGALDVRIRPCSACLGEKPRVLYLNCNHLVMCLECDRRLQTRNCSICRAPIVSTAIVFYG